MTNEQQLLQGNPDSLQNCPGAAGIHFLSCAMKKSDKNLIDNTSKFFSSNTGSFFNVKKMSFEPRINVTILNF